jgi:hypothetical protein
MRYITRMEKYGSMSWWVRLQTAGLQKSFPDKDYESTGAALDAAIKWRDEQIIKHPDRGPGYKDKDLKEYGKPRKNNTTGVDGVMLTYLSDRNSLQFHARYYEDGRLRKKCFTIGKKYDVDEAFYLAAKARYELTGRGKEFETLKLDFEHVRKQYKKLYKLHFGD